jgi:hypothetical protein
LLFGISLLPASISELAATYFTIAGCRHDFCYRRRRCAAADISPFRRHSAGFADITPIRHHFDASQLLMPPPAIIFAAFAIAPLRIATGRRFIDAPRLLRH